jgi:hypothetical protein
MGEIRVARDDPVDQIAKFTQSCIKEVSVNWNTVWHTLISFSVNPPRPDPPQSTPKTTNCPSIMASSCPETPSRSTRIYTSAPASSASAPPRPDYPSHIRAINESDKYPGISVSMSNTTRRRTARCSGCRSVGGTAAVDNAREKYEGMKRENKGPERRRRQNRNPGKRNDSLYRGTDRLFQGVSEPSPCWI